MSTTPTEGNDELTFSEGNDSIDALGGDDTLVGGAGNDTLTGNSGHDFFAWQADQGDLGRDLVTDLALGDTLQFRSLLITGLVAGDGAGLQQGQVAVGAYNAETNKTTIAVGTDSAAGADLFIDLLGRFTTTNFQVANDTVAGLGNLAFQQPFNAIRGTPGFDFLSGTSGADSMDGFEGSNSFNAGAGDDLLVGGSGWDTMTGGLGNDTLDGGAGDADRAVYLNASAAVSVDLSTGLVTGGDGSDFLSSIEQVEGSAFNDTLVGNAADNVLRGNGGNDSITGGDGNDNLEGGGGNDTLTGGAGNDLFQVQSNTPFGVVRITDLTPGDALYPFTSDSTLLTTNNPAILLANQMLFGATANGVTRLYLGLNSSAGADAFVDIVGAVSAQQFTKVDSFNGYGPAYRFDGGSNLGGQVYAWKNHALLSAATVDVSSVGTSATGADGTFQFTGVASGSYMLLASRAATDSGTAVNSADALAALRIAVGANPNSGTLRLSPYQVIAADVNEDGKVNSADALAILRMAVKAPTAPAQKWIFVHESLDLWNEATGAPTLSRTGFSWQNSPVNVQANTSANLVGVLLGDVNGSWVAPGASQVVDQTVLQAVATKMAEPTDVFGF